MTMLARKLPLQLFTLRVENILIEILLYSTRANNRSSLVNGTAC